VSVARLSVAVTDNALTRPIIDGDVTPDGVDWTPIALHPSELFWRQLHFADFDVFEMSLSTSLRLASLGDRRWVVLPVFTTRSLAHLSVIVTERSGIRTPEDLRGRRIGVPEYQQTSAVWSRGVLERDFGVRPEEIRWSMERGSVRSHGSATAFQAPEGVEVETIAETESIGHLLADGRLDGSLLYLSSPNLVDRSPVLDEVEVGIRPLFEPAAERERLAGAPLHANHCLAIRRELAEAMPWLVLNVFEAFVRAKDVARDRLAVAIAPWAQAGGAFAAAAARVPGSDPAPYGYAANEGMLRELAGFVLRQGIAVRPVDPAELFAPQALAT